MNDTLFIDQRYNLPWQSFRLWSILPPGGQTCKCMILKFPPHQQINNLYLKCVHCIDASTKNLAFHTAGVSSSDVLTWIYWTQMCDDCFNALQTAGPREGIQKPFCDQTHFPSHKSPGVDIFVVLLSITFGSAAGALCSAAVRLWDCRVQLLPVCFFFSANSSICFCRLSMISSFLASLRARSWALSSPTSSKNLCLHDGKTNKRQRKSQSHRLIKYIRLIILTHFLTSNTECKCTWAEAKSRQISCFSH